MKNNYLKRLFWAVLFIFSLSSAQAQYTVTTSVNPASPAGGVITGAEGTFTSGQTVTLTATPNDGYEFYRWRDASGYHTENPYVFTITGNTTVRAYFNVAQTRYNVSIVNGTPGSEPYVTIEGAGQKGEGEAFTISATYTFPYNGCHWYLNGQEVSAGDSYTYTNEGNGIQSDLEFTVYFDYIPQERTISVATNDANLGTVQIASLGEQSNTSLNIYEGQQVTLTATRVDNNAIFAGWYLGTTRVSDDLVYQFTLPNGTPNCTYTAKFIAPGVYFTMRAEKVGGNGGTLSPSAPESVQAGSSFTFSVGQVYNGWVFDGWFDAQGNSADPVISLVVEDVTLYAHFHHMPYNVTAVVNPSGAGTVTPAQAEVAAGGSITFNAAANAGYRFLNWNGNANNTNTSYTVSPVNNDMEVTANFMQTFAVTATATQGAAPTVSANTTAYNGRYDAGSQVTVTAGQVDGYEFAYWTVNGTPDNQATNAEYVINSLSEDITLVANYAPVYRVRLYKNNNNVVVTLNGAGNYREGANAEVSATFDNNLYTFNGWSNFGNQNIISTDNPYQFAVNSNVDLTANFTVNTVYHTVTVNTEGTGCYVTSDQIANIVSGQGNQVEANSEITLVPHAVGNYRLVRWTVDNTNYPAAQYPTYTTTVNSDLTITAVFEEASVYHVTFLTDPENEPIIEFIGVNPGGIYASNEALDVTVTAHGNPNYQFVGWLLNGRLYRSARTEHLQIAHVTSDMEFTAMYDVYQSDDIDYLVYDDEVAKTTIVGVQDGYRTSISSVTIPASVVAIADNAFRNCTSLSSLVIPSNVQTIGNYAFDGCSALNTVILPDGVSLGTYVFNNCRTLRNVELPASMTTIPEGLFYGCNDLASVTIPSGVTSVGSFAFYGCRNIYTLTVPASVTTIGAQSFASMNGLRFVNLAAGIETVGSNAFENSTHIVLTNFEGSLSDWLAISFENENSQPVSRSRNLAINGELLSELNVPAGITEIKPYAFYGDTLISEITLPADVATIGDKSFYHLKGLERITLHSLPANVSANAFEGVSADVVVAVPCGMDVQARNQQWGGFTNFVTDGMPVLTLEQRPGGTVSIEQYPSCSDAEYVYQIIANNGMNYQFQSWSDGNTEQSRNVTLTEDMTLSPIWVRVENSETMMPTYSCAFENSKEKSAWFGVAPGANKWYIGNAVHQQSVLGGTKSLYVTTDENGANNEYDDEGLSTYVFTDVYMYEGINEIGFSYRVAGNEGDYMSVAILPDEMNYEDLSPYANGAILVADNLTGDGDTWQPESRMVNIERSGWRKVAFFWNVTDDDNRTDVAAAVDNLSVLYRTPNNLQYSFIDVNVEVAAASNGMGTAYAGETPGVTSKRFYYGDQIAVHAVAADNEHQFVQWQIGDRVVSTESDYTLDFVEYWGSDPTLTAVFELVPTTYTVTVTLQDGAANASTEYGVMNANGVINAVTAIDNSQDADLYLNLPQEGWAFMGWADEDGNIVATDNPFTYTGRANAHFIAVMKEYRDCPDYIDPDYTNPSEPGVNPNTPELREVIVSNIKVSVENDQIVVENTGDYTVTLYDVAGRALESRISPDQKIYFSVPLSGSYLVRVGNLMTQRVVVVR